MTDARTLRAGRPLRWNAARSDARRDHEQAPRPAGRQRGRAAGICHVAPCAGDRDAGFLEHRQRLEQAFTPPVEHVVVGEHAAVDAGDGQARQVVGVHPVVNGSCASLRVTLVSRLTMRSAGRCRSSSARASPQT
jgi:hypothetical protein